MEELELYLLGNYVKEKDLQKQVKELIEKAIPFYNTFKENGYGWPYEIDKCNKNLSFSTTAMIAFSLSILMGTTIDLIGCKDVKHDYKIIEDKDKYEKYLTKSIDLIIKNYIDKGKFESFTYGDNDPFTINWVYSLISKYQGEVGEFTKTELEKVCIKKVKEIFEDICNNKDKVRFSSKIDDNGEDIYPIEKTHIFPLLKTVQLYVSLNIKEVNDTYRYRLKNIMENKLHYHLSLANIKNSNFDAAELIFALEGLLLLDDNRENFDKSVLNRVFDVIKERQNLSLYWRPLKPFVTNEQGLALLPISVEIAMSLIRICRLLGKEGEKLFSRYFDIFKNYTNWIKSRLVKKDNIYGWCSEHVDSPDKIHTWETSQVIIYLTNFNDMLQKHISYQLFKYANFSVKELESDNNAWNEFKKNEPLYYKPYDVYEEIYNKYLDNNDKYRSMLIYGPPGTGKSTIAEKISSTLGYPLVTITPSDFITSGTDNVENKTKNIFKVLEEQRDKVVLFDEIDRLILDRDCDYYMDQSDMFQFMTPSMLVKIKDLREKNNIIFIIATNYEERIDKAIKRIGRIDNSFLVLPPCKDTRKNIFYDIISKQEKKDIKDEQEKKALEAAWKKIKGKEIEDVIINSTALYTYKEFEKLIYSLIDELKTDTKFEINRNVIPKPSISILSYSKKIGIEKNEKVIQKPITEFLVLVYLKCEVYELDKNCYNSFDEDEIELISRFICSKNILNIKLDETDTIDQIIAKIKKENRKKEKINSKVMEYLRNKEMSEKITDVINEMKGK